jgi:Domain of unknown function (DUF4390)
MLQRLQMLVRNLLVLAFIVALAGPAAHAQSVDLPTLGVERRDGSLQLEFVARVQLSRAVEDALSRGVPVYFAAQATLYRNRWYWRDERVARVGRTWRLAYQPLTSNWRVGVGAITQTFPTLAEALSVITRTSGWKFPARHQPAAQPDADRADQPGRVAARRRAHAEGRVMTQAKRAPAHARRGTPGPARCGAARPLAPE